MAQLSTEHEVGLVPTPDQGSAALERLRSLGVTDAQIIKWAHEQWEHPFDPVQLKTDFLAAIQATAQKLRALAEGDLREDRRGQKQLFRGFQELLRQAPKITDALQGAEGGISVQIDVSMEEEPLPWRRPPLYCPKCKALVDGRPH